MILTGHCIEVLATLPEQSVHTCVTSPPYWSLRNDGVPPVGWEDGWTGQLGQEPTPAMYVAHLVQVFRAVRRVLRDDGTLWVNLGDTYAAARGGGHMPAERIAGAVAGYTREGKRSDRGRGDSYTPSRDAPAFGLKHKDLVGIPWRFAFAAQDDGWYLRQDIIWQKPNPAPESVSDRCTKAHEYLFLFAKSEQYRFDRHAISEPAVTSPASRATLTRPAPMLLGGAPTALGDVPGAESAPGADPPRSYPTRQGLEGRRNRRSVWSVPVGSFRGAHFATFPPDLVRPCILAGAPVGGTVLDPFSGSGTTVLVAEEHGRIGIGIEINPVYVALSVTRIQPVLPFWGAQP